MAEEDVEPAEDEPAEAPEPSPRLARPRESRTKSHNIAAGIGNASVLRFQRQLAAMEPFKNVVGFSDRMKLFDLPILDRLMRDQMKVADIMTPSFLRATELSATARISELVVRATGVSSWRSTMLTDALIQDLAKRPMLPTLVTRGLLDDLLRTSASAVTMSRWVADVAPGRDLLRGLSADPLRRYRQFLDALPTEPLDAQLLLSLAGGRGVNGLMGAELLTGDVDEDDKADAAALVDVEIIEPWTAGPASARSELLVVLGGIDATVPELLNGAWDDLVRQGPAALTKIANCAVEALDRSLRAAARDDDVLQWVVASKKPPEFIDAKGRPTRAGRLHYLLRDRKGERKLIDSQASALVVVHGELISRLQASKHASAGNVAAVRAYL